MPPSRHRSSSPTQLICKAFSTSLWSALLHAGSATLASGAQAESVGNGGVDGTPTRDTAIIAALLVVFLLLVAGVVVYIRHKHSLHDKKEEKREEASEVKEWLYSDSTDVKGPFTNTQMRQFWVAGVLNRETKAKVVWWSSDFAPLASLFPQVGTEFVVPAKTDDKEARKSGWHRYSVLAQPTDAVAASLVWYYQLPNGSEEGPFETGKMRHWFVTGFFDENILVRYEGARDASFLPLRDHFPNISQAFDTLPKGCSSEQARQSMHTRMSVLNSSQTQGRSTLTAGREGLGKEVPAPAGQATSHIEPWRASQVSQGQRASERSPMMLQQTIGKETP